MVRAVRKEVRSILLGVALFAAIAACADRTPTGQATDSAASDAAVRPQFAPGVRTAAIEVTVRNHDGSPAPGVIVTAVGPDGPFDHAGNLAVAETNAGGVAVLPELPTGVEYCVHARPITRAAATVSLVPPPNGSSAGNADPDGQAPVLTGRRLASVPVTKANYLEFCVSDRPLRLNNGDASLKLTFGQATRLNMSLVDLEGVPLEDAAWAILPFERNEIPWAWWRGIAPDPGDVPKDIKPGLLQSAAAGGSGFHVAVQAGQPYFVEVLTAARQSPAGPAHDHSDRQRGGDPR